MQQDDGILRHSIAWFYRSTAHGISTLQVLSLAAWVIVVFYQGDTSMMRRQCLSNLSIHVLHNMYIILHSLLHSRLFYFPN